MAKRITDTRFWTFTVTSLLLFSYSSACVQDVEFEAENGEPSYGQCTPQNAPPCINFRNRASGGLSVYLRERGQSVSHTFTTVSECSLEVNVYYSNDGFRDTLAITLDNEEIGKFHTRVQSGGGRLWNTFLTSGNVGDEKRIPPGEHNLKVSVLSDDGVELDKFEVLFQCEGDVCPTATTQTTDPLEILLLNIARSKKTA